MKHLVLACAVLASLVCGCAPPVTRAPVRREIAPADLSRADAIRAARSDAAARFGEGWIAWTSASRLGRYWVVELRAADGRGLRYAISTSDGSIRQRSLFQ